MTPFEYVIVLVSIILGMGITQIVTGVADLVHQSARTKAYWPHLLWIVIVFILHIQDWWSTYELRTLDGFRLPTFLFILLYPINLFILARLLFPIQTDGEIDLKKFYHANYKKLFLLAGLLPVISLISNIIFLHLPFWTQYGHVALLSTFIILLTRRSLPETVHKVLAVVLITSLLIALASTWDSLLR